MKKVLLLFILVIHFLSCTDNKEVHLKDGCNLELKQQEIFLNYIFNLDQDCELDYALLKFEQNYFGYEPFLDVWTKVENSNKQQYIFDKPLVNGINNRYTYDLTKEEEQSYENMNFKIGDEIFEFLDLNPIEMIMEDEIKALVPGQSIKWNSSLSKGNKILIIIKIDLIQSLDEGKTTLGEFHPFSKILIDDIGEHIITNDDLSIFEIGTPLEMILVRGDYYLTEIDHSKLIIGTFSMYNSDSYRFTSN